MRWGRQGEDDPFLKRGRAFAQGVTGQKEATMSPIRIPDQGWITGQKIENMPIEERIVHTYKTGSIVGIIIGGLIAFLGIFLLLFGLTGSIDWFVNVGGISSKLINASPGVAIVVVGMIILIRYKPRIRYEYEIRKTLTEYDAKGSVEYHAKGSGVASSPITSR